MLNCRLSWAFSGVPRSAPASTTLWIKEFAPLPQRMRSVEFGRIEEKTACTKAALKNKLTLCLLRMRAVVREKGQLVVERRLTLLQCRFFAGFLAMMVAVWGA